MIQGSIAIRYARALYEEAKAQSVDETIYENLKVLHANLKATPDLQVALVNPRISKDKKYQLLVTASGINLGNRIPADTVASSESYRSSLYTRFLRLLLEHNRENKIRLIIFVYCDLFREERKIDKVVFETATPVDEATVQKLIAKVKSHTQREVECECKVNPSLIGGFRLRIGEHRYDHSFRARLEQIRAELCS